jgi:type VI secretion system protein ImpF
MTGKSAHPTFFAGKPHPYNPDPETRQYTMAEIRSDKPLVSSVLDRLIDERPDQTREPAKSQNQVLSELRQSVRRDLESLLNTRMRCTEWPGELEELERSLINYGIPDVSAASLQSEQGRRAYLKHIERTIRQFEPRFKSVRVVPLENADYLDRTLRFRIDALMYASPAPQTIVFDTALAPDTGSFSVKDGGS